MCGRYANFRAKQELIDAFSIAVVADDVRLLPPSFNIAPTTNVDIVRTPKGDPRLRELAVARWGLVPPWAKDPSVGVKMFNARIETVAEKPSYRTAFAKRRCIMPASGYYEWKSSAGGKIPYYIHPADGGVLAFAGLMEFWKDKAAGDNAEWLVSCSMLTTAARGDMRQIYDRQPVMLTKENWEVWLDPGAKKSDLFVAAAAPTPELAWHAVGREVGNSRADGPSLIEPVPIES